MSSSGSHKDPRQIREKSWQANAIRTLINFLVQSGYDKPISPKMLQNPSAKDFQSIFKFLYAQFDPNYSFQKKFEEEVIYIIRALKYPFVEQISRSHLHAPGSIHSWPLVLAMLEYMVELVLACDELGRQQGDLESNTQAGFSEKMGERLFFDYVTKAYHIWMAGQDDYSQLNEELSRNFDEKNAATLVAIEQLEKENANLAAEYQVLTNNDSPLIYEQKQQERYRQDAEKYDMYIETMTAKTVKLKESIQRAKEQLGKVEAEQQELRKQRQEFQNLVDAQEISPADVAQMNAESEQLKANLELAIEKAKNTAKAVWDKEIVRNKSMDRLEELVQAYNALCFELKVEELFHQYLGPEETPHFEVEFDTNASTPDQFLSVDLKRVVHVKLQQLLVQLQTKLGKTQESLLSIQEQLERLTEQSTEKAEHLVRLELTTKNANLEYTRKKEAMAQEASAALSEIDSLERQLQDLRIMTNADYGQMKARVEQLTSEYEQKIKDADEQALQQDEELKALGRSLQSLKSHVGNSLKSLNDLVNAEYQKLISHKLPPIYSR